MEQTQYDPGGVLAFWLMQSGHIPFADSWIQEAIDSTRDYVPTPGERVSALQMNMLRVALGAGQGFNGPGLMPYVYRRAWAGGRCTPNSRYERPTPWTNTQRAVACRSFKGLVDKGLVQSNDDINLSPDRKMKGFRVTSKGFRALIANDIYFEMTFVSFCTYLLNFALWGVKEAGRAQWIYDRDHTPEGQAWLARIAWRRAARQKRKERRLAGVRF